MMLTILRQAKQLQIDELLSRLNNSAGDLERLREDKDQEIMILQAAMDNTIEQLSDAQQVSLSFLEKKEKKDLIPLSTEPRSGK
jgi:hypothetical protein